MGAKVIFSTAGIEPRHRLDLWRSTLADLFAPVEVTDIAAGAFRAEIAALSVGDLSMTKSVSVAQTFVRTSSVGTSIRQDDYAVSIQLNSAISYTMAERTMAEARNGIVLFDMARHHRCRAVDGLQDLCIHVPRAVLDLALGPVTDAVGLSIPPDNPSSPLIRGFFRSVMDQGDAFDPSTSQRLGSIGLDLLTAGFADVLARRARVEMGADTLVYRAKAFLEERLGDTTLSPATAAAALGLPAARLHALFAAQDLTVDGYLGERRLAKVCKRFRDPACDRVATADIARDAGFLSIVQFARRFRRRFGMTPLEFRADVRSHRLVG